MKKRKNLVFIGISAFLAVFIVGFIVFHESTKAPSTSEQASISGQTIPAEEQSKVPRQKNKKWQLVQVPMSRSQTFRQIRIAIQTQKMCTSSTRPGALYVAALKLNSGKIRQRFHRAVTIIETDFDSNRDLRQKYGVTYQYTFVQVDQDGTETNQWTADTVAKVLAGIQ